jgi:amidase
MMLMFQRPSGQAGRGADFMVADGVFAPAHVLAEAIRRRAVSSEEGAIARAREADAALGRDETWGVLHGVPITLEDIHPTSGMPTTWGGLPRLADHVPAEDGTVAARLKAAGGVLLGKTNGPEVWPDSIFDRTNNPWNLAHTPGGSSAGVGADGRVSPTPRLLR